jgi:hypothetical protein
MSHYAARIHFLKLVVANVLNTHESTVAIYNLCDLTLGAMSVCKLYEYEVKEITVPLDK